MKYIFYLIVFICACRTSTNPSPIIVAKYVENDFFYSYNEDTALQVLGSQQAMDNFFKPSFFEQLTYISFQNNQVLEYAGNRYYFNNQGFPFSFQKKIGSDSLLAFEGELEPIICQAYRSPPPKSTVSRDTIILPRRIINLDILHIAFYGCHELLNVWWEEKIGVLAYKGKDWAMLLDKIYIFGEQTDSICFQPLHFAFAKQQSVKYK